MGTATAVGAHEARLAVGPVALWTAALACEMVYRFASPEHVWLHLGFYAMGAGAGGALATGAFALPRALAAADPRRRRSELVNLSVTAVAVACSIAYLMLRTQAPANAALPPALALAGLVLLGVSTVRQRSGGATV